jgi:hypothetical protein
MSPLLTRANNPVRVSGSLNLRYLLKAWTTPMTSPASSKQVSMGSKIGRYLATNAAMTFAES